MHRVDHTEVVTNLFQSTGTNPTQKNRNKQGIVCFVCGKLGHIAPKCPKWNTLPNHEWWINKMNAQAEQHFQQAAIQDAEAAAQGAVLFPAPWPFSADDID